MLFSCVINELGYMISLWCGQPCSVGSSSPVPVPSPWPCWHSTPGRLAPGGTIHVYVEIIYTYQEFLPSNV